MYWGETIERSVKIGALYQFSLGEQRPGHLIAVAIRYLGEMSLFGDRPRAGDGRFR